MVQDQVEPEDLIKEMDEQRDVGRYSKIPDDLATGSLMLRELHELLHRLPTLF